MRRLHLLIDLRIGPGIATAEGNRARAGMLTTEHLAGLDPFAVDPQRHADAAQSEKLEAIRHGPGRRRLVALLEFGHAQPLDLP